MICDAVLMDGVMEREEDESTEKWAVLAVFRLKGEVATAIGIKILSKLTIFHQLWNTVKCSSI